jgi:mersacidin/lichenicidin family type 2 lantibiotic
MSNLDIIRAWKDRAYRQSLSSEQQALLPEHPAGEIELSEGDLDQVQGANTLPEPPTLVFICHSVTTVCLPTAVPCLPTAACTIPIG